jgi:hypothetical protein
MRLRVTETEIRSLRFCAEFFLNGDKSWRSAVAPDNTLPIFPLHCLIYIGYPVTYRPDCRE